MKKVYLVLFVLQFISIQSFAQQKKSSNQVQQPKLVIGLVIDQMRWDYLVRFQERFKDGGFRRLTSKGFNYHNAYISYSPSVTAAGHATIYTGANPAIHGIVGNTWIERSDESRMYCASDTNVRSVGGSKLQGQMSPRNLLATTIGDELKLATNFRSRVFGIAMKDRGGIFPAGRSADAAYWFDDSTGNWISSTWYMNQLPDWVKRYNSLKKTDSLAKVKWDLLYDPKTYVQSTVDEMPFERTISHETKTTFPHDYTSLVQSSNYYSFRQSPYGNTLTLDFATWLIDSKQLGKSAETDMLCISLSSTDYLGHQFGPYAVEIEDMYLRLDTDLSRFLDKLDKNIGEGNYLLFLTSDHAAPHTPGWLQSKRISAGTLNAYALVDELDKYCSRVFGVKGLVNRFYPYQFYLNRRKIDSMKLSFQVITDTIVDYLERRPEVARAFSYEKMYQTILPSDQRVMIENGFFNGRSGDIHLILKPQYTEYQLSGTDHGSLYNYDTHIPLIFFGSNIKAGETFRKVDITDIAPTISAILKVQCPNGSVGKVLEEIVK